MADRKRGVTVKVLDLQPLIDQILSEVRAKIRPDIHGIEIQGDVIAKFKEALRHQATAYSTDSHLLDLFERTVEPLVRPPS